MKEHDYEVKVQTVTFNLRVFTSISGNPLRNYTAILADQLDSWLFGYFRLVKCLGYVSERFQYLVRILSF